MPCNQPRRKNLKKTILIAWTACTGLWPAFGQVKQTKEQIPFYESQWAGERFPDGDRRRRMICSHARCAFAALPIESSQPAVCLCAGAGRRRSSALARSSGERRGSQSLSCCLPASHSNIGWLSPTIRAELDTLMMRWRYVLPDAVAFTNPLGGWSATRTLPPNGPLGSIAMAPSNEPY